MSFADGRLVFSLDTSKLEYGTPYFEVVYFCVKFEEICRAKGIQCEKAPRAALLKALVD